jgi:hypothetical protein
MSTPPLCYNRLTLTSMALQERPRPADVRLFRAYAEELREAFRSGFLSEFTRLRQGQFVVWRHRMIDGTAHKPPFDPKTSKLANPADPDSWGTFDQALLALQTGWYNGVGLVFAKKDPRYPRKRPDPFAGMDLDQCAHPNRSIDKWARDIIEFLQTHTHYSPRDGVHLIMEVGEAGLPGENRKVGNMEFFDRNHFLTITPHLVPGTPRTIEPRRLETAYLYLRSVPRELWSAAQKNTRGVSGRGHSGRRHPNPQNRPSPRNRTSR